MDIEGLIAACREAGDAALSLRVGAVRTKEDGSPVTDADMRAHDVLLSHLSKTGSPIVSEESQPIPPHDTDRAWIIDPIDGTASFIANDPGWAVMAALIEEALPIMAVVYAPALQCLWLAEKGSGAYVERDGSRKKLAVSKISDTQSATMLLSIHHPSKASIEVANMLGARQERKSGLGIKACMVAEGSADLYWTEASLGEWDACAPQLIVEEAGGVFADARGNAIKYGSQEERPIRGISISNMQLRSKLISAAAKVLDA